MSEYDDPVVFKDPQEFFAVAWPAMVPMLRNTLARAGVPVADRDDNIQETAIRLLRAWDTIDQSRGIDAYARRVAINVWRDNWRKHGKREVIGDVPEQPVVHDTERVALARLEVGEVARAIDSLRPGVARVLRAAATELERDEAHAPVPAALRVARSRARKALSACLKVASGIAVVLGLTRPAVRSGARPLALAGSVTGIAALLAIAASPSSPPTSHPVAKPALIIRPSLADLPHQVDIADRDVRHPVRRHMGAGVPAATTKPKDTSPPYYKVQAGPADVGVFASLDVDGNGVKIRQPDSGSATPVCVYGAATTTTAPLTC